MKVKFTKVLAPEGTASINLRRKTATTYTHHHHKRDRPHWLWNVAAVFTTHLAYGGGE